MEDGFAQNEERADDRREPERTTPSAGPPVDLSVLVPAYNEEASLSELAERTVAVFRRLGITGELILVDDGSTDGTPEVIRRLEAFHPDVRGMFHGQNLGIAAAWHSAALGARGRLVVTIDADLQYQPEDIERLHREYLAGGTDVVQGWRSLFGREKDNRYYLSRGLNALLNLLFGLRFRDVKSGFLLTTRECFLDILRHQYSYFYFQSFNIIAAVAKGYRVKEVETIFEARKAGTSFISSVPLVLVGKVLMDTFKAFLEYRLFHRKDDTFLVLLSETPPLRKPPPRPLSRRVHWGVYRRLMPVHHWMIGHSATSYHEELQSTQWLSSETLRDLQERRLRSLVKHAYEEVPFYREKLNTLGISPEDVSSLEDLGKLPFLEKNDIRKHWIDLLSQGYDHRKIQRLCTSGSTGEPLTFFCDKTQLEIRWATTIRNLEWTGWRFGDPHIRLWHQTLGMSSLQAWKEKLDALLMRRYFVPAFQIDGTSIQDYVKLIRRVRPTLLDGYAESFNCIAAILQKETLRDLPPPKGIVSSAQTLSEASRAVVEEVFGCRVFDKYGSREFSGIAFECDQHQGLHVNAESYVVEVLKDGRPAKPGEIGEVVVTDLNNRCMPFIRYRLGDLAVPTEATPCPCGRGLPKIDRIEGRVQAIILGSNGRYLPGTFFAHLLKDYDYAIRQFQVVQEREGAITFKIVKGPRFENRRLESILDILHAHLGVDMPIQVEFVDHIPLGPTGKHYHSVSKLDLDFQESGLMPS